MILEPLQVMLQLALLSHCPIGTKVSVSDNILQIQKPTLLQGVWRWYNSDGKDDLYYLFHAIRRYYKWYKSDGNRIYNYILTNKVVIEYERYKRIDFIPVLVKAEYLFNADLISEFC